MNSRVIVLKNNIKIYIKIAPTCFGAFMPSSGSALFVLANLHFSKTTTFAFVGDKYFDNIKMHGTKLKIKFNICT